MNRAQLCVALAQYTGQELTVDVAREIVRIACAEPDISIDPARFKPEHCGQYLLQCERLAEILVEHRSLQSAYLGEVGGEDGAPPAYDEEAALSAERLGARLQFTARTADGGLVGILGIYLHPDGQTGHLSCTDDCIYLSAGHRGGALARRLWGFGERCAFAVGVRSARFHLREVNGAGRLARFMGYRPVATQFIKVASADAIALPGRHDHHPKE